MAKRSRVAKQGIRKLRIRGNNYRICADHGRIWNQNMVPKIYLVSIFQFDMRGDATGGAIASEELMHYL